MKIKNLLRSILNGKNYIGLSSKKIYIFNENNGEIYINGEPIKYSNLELIDLLNMDFYDIPININRNMYFEECDVVDLYDNNGKFIAIFNKDIVYNAYFENRNLILENNGEKIYFDNEFDLNALLIFDFYRLLECEEE